jgi:hypothetical protein
MDSIGLLIAGVVLTLQGLSILFVPDYQILYYGHRIGPYPSFVGVIFMIGGALLIYAGIKNIVKERKEEVNTKGLGRSLRQRARFGVEQDLGSALDR